MHLTRTSETVRTAGFTLAEICVAVGLLGLGVASTIGALTQINSVASNARNRTGAYTILMNQVDFFQSMSPFNPQKTNANADPCSGATGTAQIPKDVCHGSFPLYDMTVGTHNLSVNGTDWNVPVYEYRDQNGNVVLVVNGTLTETVTNLTSSTPALSNTYQAVFTITYTFRNRTYTYSLSSIRTSDI
jgi:Tfp pilus assembly protein PilV